MRVVAALFLLAACDRVWDLELREPPDAPDAPEVDAKTCDPGTPFGPGTAVRIDGAYSVEAARFDPTQSIAAAHWRGSPVGVRGGRRAVHARCRAQGDS